MCECVYAFVAGETKAFFFPVPVRILWYLQSTKERKECLGPSALRTRGNKATISFPEIDKHTRSDGHRQQQSYEQTYTKDEQRNRLWLGFSGGGEQRTVDDRKNQIVVGVTASETE